jgi:DNA-binding transcriptional regulator YdaS (Cro superfamily)
VAAVLDSIDDLIAALGGPTAVAKIAGVQPSAVCQWTYPRGRPRRAAIPPEHYPKIRRACAAKGYHAPPQLFRCLHCNSLPDVA